MNDELSVYAVGMGVGKSMVSHQMIGRAQRAGKNVLHVSWEMMDDEMHLRYVKYTDERVKEDMDPVVDALIAL